MAFKKEENVKSTCRSLEPKKRKVTRNQWGEDQANIRTKAEDDHVADLADMHLRPTVQAAGIVHTYRYGNDDGAGITELSLALWKQVQAANNGDLQRSEAMLISQAHSLDAIFGYLARRAAINFGGHLEAAERYMRLALKAQTQCRTTLETLASVKNPPNVAFIQQANVAQGNQQVNNGLIPGSTSSARENETGQNKLLEATDGERLDTRKARFASTANSDLEALAAIDRSNNTRR